MEDDLGAYSDIRSYRYCDVLILVLMGYGLGQELSAFSTALQDAS